MSKYIQGDVIFRCCAKIPEGSVLVKDNVVVRGDNHSHVLEGGLLYENNGQKFIDVAESGVISHNTHGPINLPPAFYVVSIAKEYDHFAEEAREVRD